MAWKKVVTESSSGNISQKAATAGTADTVTTNANLTGDVTSSGNATTIATDAVDIAMLSASGTAGSSTFLRGDNTWATPTDISNLNTLTDTTIDGTPADGEVLVYDTTNKWQNQTLAETGIQPLDADLTALASCQSGAASALALLTSTEVAILDGANVTTTELNKLDGFAGDVNDLNYAMDLKATGVSSTEFDYLDGVTGAIQSQIDAKEGNIGALNRVDATNVGTGVVDNTEFNYLNGVTSAIQTQIAAKAPIASPEFTGNAKAVTAATGANDTLIATTAFVKAQAYATLDAPALTGVPTAPTAIGSTNTTQIATTAFVHASSSNYTDSLNATYWQANAARTIGNSGATLTVAGNLTVSGTTTTINTEQLNVEDNVVILNSNATGSTTPDVNAGIEVERGDRANVSIVWDEGTHVWTQSVQKHSDSDADDARGMIPMVETGTGTSGDAHAVGNFYLNTSTDQLYVNVG